MSQTQLARNLGASNAAVLPEMDVAATDSGCGHVDEAFACGGRRDGDFDDGELVGRVGCDGDVCLFESGGGGHLDGSVEQWMLIGKCCS